VTVRVDLTAPQRVLAVGAHPDDVEFGCGATLAKWAATGAEVHVCVLTDGSKGSWDAADDPEQLVLRRMTEQRAALERIGARELHAVGRVDGELENDAATRELVCRIIRAARPDVVLGHDPWPRYRLHPDHRNAGLLTMESIVAARDPHFFSDAGVPHRPRTLLLFETETIDHLERVDGFVDAKIEALLCHRSQWRSTMGIDERPEEQTAAFARSLHQEAKDHGLRLGLRACEAFKRVDDL
jgi:LmbE family N-acetylglucosaminyl deacetylase